MKEISWITKAFIKVIDTGGNNKYNHINIGDEYELFSTNSKELSFEQIQILDKYKSEGYARVQTTPSHIENVYGKLYFKFTQIVEV